MTHRQRISCPKDWGKSTERMFPFLLLLSAGSILLVDGSLAILWLLREHDLFSANVLLIGLPSLFFGPLLSLVGLAFGERPRWLSLVTVAATALLLILLKFAAVLLD